MSVDSALGTRSFDAQNSQGFVNHPTGPVTQHFGDNVTITFPRAGWFDRLQSRLPNAFQSLLTLVERARPEVAGDIVYRTCRASLPPTAVIVNTDVAPILLADMCEQPWAKPWPPLLECVTRLAALGGIPVALAAELHRWVDDAAPTFSVSPDSLTQLRGELQGELARRTATAFSWLQVYLEPDWTNRTQDRKQPVFRVELVLWSSRTMDPQVLSADVRAAEPNGPALWTLEELPSLLDAVLADRQNIELVEDMNHLAIEVVAPCDTLLHGFERWKRKQGTDTYGLFHPIVVRLRDRLEIPDAADQARADSYWRGKWAAFLNCAGDEGPARLAWHDPDALDAFDLQDDADAFCLGVTSPLTPGSRDVFDLLRDAGIPIALWLRSPDASVNVPLDWSQQVTAWIAGRPIADLHQAIWKIRRMKAVRSDAAHFANFLTLLWDDPKRPPLKYEQEGVFQ